MDPHCQFHLVVQVYRVGRVGRRTRCGGGDEESRVDCYVRPVTNQRFRAIGDLSFDDCPLFEGGFSCRCSCCPGGAKISGLRRFFPFSLSDETN